VHEDQHGERERTEARQVTTDGRDEEFEDFYRVTWTRMFRVAYGVAGDRLLAEDALQTAYAKAYAGWSRVQAAERPEAYVCRMAVNEVLSALRRPWHRSERPHEDPVLEPAPSHESATVERDALWRAVCALPPRQRAVVVLRYYEQLSEAEIATTLDCSRGTVKSQASAALTRLRSLEPALLAGDLA
jgi:RNA polymerase sigma-70 factor (sigma-E family)